MHAQRVKLEGLDALRFFAATAIVLFHLVQMPKLPIPDYLNFIPDRFALGVPLFYLVSAFGLTLGYFGKLQTEADIKHYFIRRYFRIAPLFYVMMLFYVAFLYAMFGKIIDVSQLLTSGLFVFNFVPQHTAGFVWASWSIGVEMAFYLILPILLFAVTSARRALALFAITVFLSAMWLQAFHGVGPQLKTFGNYFILSYMPYFAAGVLGYFVWRRARFSLSDTQQMQLGAVMILAGSFILLASYLQPPLQLVPPGPTLRKVMFALGLMTFTVGLVMAPFRLFVNRMTAGVGKTSYSIYLWHPVIIGILMKFEVYKLIYGALVDSMAFAACAVLTMSLLLPLAAISYRYIEIPGMRLADIALRRVTGARVATPRG